MMKILAVIPARSGSKSVPHKNIRKINEKPMLAYSIEHAKASKYINRVIVSTDSEEYAQIAKEYGAEIPFIRPAEFAKDTSLDIEVFVHALNALKEAEGYVPDMVVQLRPTYPIRNPKDIDCMIEMLLEDEAADSVRSIAPAKEIPYKMWKRDDGNVLIPFVEYMGECYNMPRQELPVVYYQNACIDVIRTNVITDSHSMSGRVIKGYEMVHNYDIDTEEEFQRAEAYMKLMDGKKRFVFDIDGVVAQLREDLDYAEALPNKPMIQIINWLHQMGNQIILFTARGFVTQIDWREITEKQLHSWGVCYDELRFGKPNADYYIDDKMLSMDTLYALYSLNQLF